ncbi:MAG: toll/interleukin-1 receptor domain-containing protein [Pseudomonadota bacterium]
MVKLFFSYSHKDEDLRDELEIHLSALKRQGIISTWHDRRISKGDEFDRVISEYLEKANIILLLVSPYFIGSDYCYEIEMKRAMDRHEKGDAIVIPVILHPCDWHDMPFGKLLACPKDGKPISKFPNMHDAFLEVTKAVKKASVKFGSNIPASQTIKVTSDIGQKSTSSHPVRSSNLRLKKEFTDREKDKFLTDAFEYIANFFEGSFAELKVRNRDVETDFRRIDASRFTATIYLKGKEASRCNIWLGDGSSFLSGILYSSGNWNNNSYNESLNVEEDGYTMYLKAMGMQLHRQDREEKMTFEGGAEYYWSMFIEYLQ